MKQMHLQHVGSTVGVCPEFQPWALRPTSCLFSVYGWGWVGLGGWGGWGGDNTKPVSRYATWSWFALDATLHDSHLHLMLRCMIFTCTWCYATWSSLALDATLHDLHLHLMLRYMIFTCTWCYATWSSLALDATLHDLHLHLTLRYLSGWGWVGGVGIIPNLSLATLHDLHLHLTLRYLGGWGRVGGVGIMPNLSLATLHDLHLHLMLRYTKFAVEGHAQTKIMQISNFSTPKNYKNAGVFVLRRQIWWKILPNSQMMKLHTCCCCSQGYPSSLLKTFKNTVKTHRQQKEDCW